VIYVENKTKKTGVSDSKILHRLCRNDTKEIVQIDNMWLKTAVYQCIKEPIRLN